MLTPDEILAGVCDATTGTCSGGLWEFIFIAGVALMTSTMLLVFIYLWGTLFRNPQLVAYVKHELYEVLVTLLLVTFILMGVGAVSTLKVSSFLPTDLMPEDVEDDTTIYASTAMYFDKVGSDMGDWLSMNYVVNMYIDQVASVTPYARPLGVGLVASPLAGIASPIKSLLYNMSVALSIAFILNYAQLAVYIFAMQAFLKYYLPLGIFLRCFTPTRRLGGTLIGLALTFLFVFPVLININYSMFYNESAGPLLSFRNMIVHYLGEDSPFWDRFSTFFTTNFTEAGGGLIDLMSGVFGGLGGLLQNILGGFFLAILMFPMATVSWAFAIGFVIPAFNTIMFIQAAKGMSKMFGEEIDITTLTRLI